MKLANIGLTAFVLNAIIGSGVSGYELISYPVFVAGAVDTSWEWSAEVAFVCLGKTHLILKYLEIIFLL